ncbi:Mucin-12 [Xylographa trunciseda]|nr:Mucin-12 [Xylographa trunciseda]
MLFARSLLINCLLVLSVSSYVIQDRSHNDADSKEALSDIEAFQQLLEQVDPPALHAALHDFSPKKFKHGVFKEDQTAVEAIHRDDAPLATSILSLAKRQESGNSSSLTAIVTVTVASTTITGTPINPSTVLPNPVEPSTRSTVPATPVPQPNSQSSSTATTASAHTTTAVATPSVSLGPGSVSVSSPVLTPGAVLTSTNAAGMTLVTLTSGAVLTTTNAAGVTVVTTIDGGVVTLSGPAGSPNGGGSTTVAGPSGSASEGSAAATSSFTSIIVQTTTLPNGVQSTITAVTVIQASNSPVVTPSGTAGAVAGGTSTAAGGLQTGLAPRTRGLGWEAVGVLGGAVGFAMML